MKLLRQLKQRIDRRTRFYDMAAVMATRRVAHANAIQFYSGHPNIGNYLPVLGIQQMLGVPLDTWNIHDKSIDFDFINRNYQCVVIGGAGLLHGDFEAFWKKFGKECKLPFVVWGVGACFPTLGKQRPVSKEVAGAVLGAADLVNIRDDLTADYYGLNGASITACPTIVYLRRFESEARSRRHVLISTHTGLLTADEQDSVRESLSIVGVHCEETDNEQSFRNGIDRIIRKKYLPASIVVTSRLHGAIIAYGLGIPYVAVSRDEKLDAFNRLYGNGVVVRGPGIEKDVVESASKLLLDDVEIGAVEGFGAKARTWFNSV